MCSKLVASVVLAVLILTNAGTIMAWLYEPGVVPLAEHIRPEYLTGGTIAVIVALLVLLPGRTVWVICVRRCPVCDAAILRRAEYYSECGSRV